MEKLADISAFESLAGNSLAVFNEFLDLNDGYKAFKRTVWDDIEDFIMRGGSNPLLRYVTKDVTGIDTADIESMPVICDMICGKGSDHHRYGVPWVLRTLNYRIRYSRGQTEDYRLEQQGIDPGELWEYEEEYEYDDGIEREIIDKLELPRLYKEWLQKLSDGDKELLRLRVQHNGTESEKAVIGDAIGESDFDQEYLPEEFYVGDKWGQLGDTDAAREYFEKQATSDWEDKYTKYAKDGTPLPLKDYTKLIGKGKFSYKGKSAAPYYPFLSEVTEEDDFGSKDQIEQLKRRLLDEADTAFDPYINPKMSAFKRILASINPKTKERKETAVRDKKKVVDKITKYIDELSKSIERDSEGVRGYKRFLESKAVN